MGHAGQEHPFLVACFFQKPVGFLQFPGSFTDSLQHFPKLMGQFADFIR